MFSPNTPARIPDYASRNDHERKLAPLPRTRPEAEIRTLIRAEFRDVAKYCPRQWSRIGGLAIERLLRCRREHSASVRREGLATARAAERRVFQQAAE